MSEQKSLCQIYPKRLDIPFLAVSSAILLVIGLSQPVITVKKLWNSNTQSILSSVGNLWHDKDYVIAFIIFFFSIVFPIVKLASLLAIWFMRLHTEDRKRLIGMMELLGRWSMLDVFVCAIIIVAVKLGALASAQIERGIYYFGASILLAMTAASLQGHLVRKN